MHKGEEKKNNLMETGFSDSSVRALNLDKDIVLRKNE